MSDTFLGPFETPAGVIPPTGAKLDIPTTDFWYVRDGKTHPVPSAHPPSA
ncbi:hypothetical protein [Streptomyces sp. NPDC002685]